MRKIMMLSALLVAQVAGMSLWFTGAAILPSLTETYGRPVSDFAHLTSLVQLGFVGGALLLAFSGTADRYDRRYLISFSCVVAAAANLTLLVLPPDHGLVSASRFLLGAALAGVYPVGMALAASWGEGNRGLLVGLLVGGLAFGSSLPHLASFTGNIITDAGWEFVLLSTSSFAAAGGFLVLFVEEGPYLPRQSSFSVKYLASAWRITAIRRAYLGYFGHMWELYAFWAWIGVAVAPLVEAHLNIPKAGAFVAFVAVGSGALGCLFSSLVADRVGKARIAGGSLLFSGLSAVCAGGSLAFGPWWLTVIFVFLWGFTVVADSPQFSALVADHAPAGQGATLLSFQTALGFALTAVVVELMPHFAAFVGWPVALASLVIGPAFGLWAVSPLAREEKNIRRTGDRAQNS